MTQPVAIQVISSGGFYGAERVLLELALYLRDQGWDSRILVLEGNGARPLLERARSLQLSAESFVTSGRLSLVPMVRRLNQTLKDLHQGILHSHGYKPDIIFSGLRIPKRLACFATCHNWIGKSRSQKALEWLDKRALRSFDAVVGVSPPVVEKLLASGVPAASVVQIKNGIGVPRIAPATRARIRHDLGIAEDEKFVIQIGRLSAEKRNALLLQIMSRMPAAIRWKLVFVGDGDQRQLLRAEANRLNVMDRVLFPGYRDDAVEMMAAADLLAMTSEDEGLPITLLEAMAVGCPIVTTAVGAIPTVLSDRKSAWVVPAHDETALAKSMQEALRDPEFATRLAASARLEFHNNYSRDAMGERYLGLYRQVWSRRGWGVP